MSDDGVVEKYLATHRVLGTSHVVEVLTPAAAHDETTTTRWLGAMRARAMIAHRNVRAIQDCGRAKDGRWYAVLAAVGARTLGELVRMRGKMPPLAALEVIVQIANGLEAIHARGVTAGTLGVERIVMSARDGHPRQPTLLDVQVGRVEPADDTRALAAIARAIVRDDAGAWLATLDATRGARPHEIAVALADATDPDPTTGVRPIDILRTFARELLDSDELAATLRGRRSPLAPTADAGADVASHASNPTGQRDVASSHEEPVPHPDGTGVIDLGRWGATARAARFTLDLEVHDDELDAATEVGADVGDAPIARDGVELGDASVGDDAFVRDTLDLGEPPELEHAGALHTQTLDLIAEERARRGVALEGRRLSASAPRRRTPRCDADAIDVDGSRRRIARRDDASILALRDPDPSRRTQTLELGVVGAAPRGTPTDDRGATCRETPRGRLPLQQPMRTPTPSPSPMSSPPGSARAARPHPKYERAEQIGSGGMAEVFRGVAHGAEGFSRPVAIKRMHAALSELPELAALFVREARIASRLLHPNIVAVHDFDRDDTDGRLVLVMELVDGVSLDQLIARGPVPPAIARFIACEALRGLGHAHAAGIVHRDASPHNILVSWHGAVKVADFGIASMRDATPAKPDGLRGKPDYLAPEQRRGEPADARADLYVIGIALWEMLTGERFAPERSPRHAAVPPAVLRLLEPAPADRYQTAEAAIAALSALAARDGAEPRQATSHLLATRFARRAPPPTATPTLAISPRRKRRRRLALLLAIVVACAMIGIAVGGFAGSR